MPLPLLVGFGFQALWSGAHLGGQFSAEVHPWFAPFAITANLGFLVCFLILKRLV